MAATNAANFTRPERDWYVVSRISAVVLLAASTYLLATFELVEAFLLSLVFVFAPICAFLTGTPHYTTIFGVSTQYFVEGVLKHIVFGTLFERMVLFYSVAVLAVLATRQLLVAKPNLLYLRRFGQTAETAPLVRMVTRGLSRSFRIWTLDDAALKPVSVSRWNSVWTWIGPPVVALSSVLAGLFIIYSRNFFFAPADQNPAIRMSDRDVYGPALIGLLYLGVPGLWFVMSLYMSGVWHLRALMRRARIGVRSSVELDVVTRRVQESRMRRALSVPRTTVVTVADELWRDAVASLAQAADGVLIDISTVTDNIAWEINWCERNCIPVVYFRGRREAANSDTPVQIPADLIVAGALTTRKGRRSLQKQLVLGIRSVLRPSQAAIANASTRPIRTRVGPFLSQRGFQTAFHLLLAPLISALTVSMLVWLNQSQLRQWATFAVNIAGGIFDPGGWGAGY